MNNQTSKKDRQMQQSLYCNVTKVYIGKSKMITKEVISMDKEVVGSGQ